MNKHIRNSYVEDINPELKEDNSNLNCFYCADVIGSKRFVVNFGGYPRSEIAQINAAADINQQVSLMQQLSDFTPDSNPTAGLSDAEIMLGHRSKYCQTASEQVQWLESQIHQKWLKAQASQPDTGESSDKINFENNENSES